MTTPPDGPLARPIPNLDVLADLRSNVRAADVATAPLLDAAECEELIAACDDDGWREAARRRATSEAVLSGTVSEPFVDTAHKSRIEQAFPSSALRLAEKIVAGVQALNVEVYGFRVVGAEDPMRVMRYRAEAGDHYTRSHFDLGPLHPLRKLSFSIMLSESHAFAGGDLEFSGTVVAASRTQGTVTVFPAFVPHRVTPLEQGERRVVVGFLLGPTFV